MRPHLNDDTAAPLHTTHTIRLRFDDTPEDQALYAALQATSEREVRTPLPRQMKHLLKMALGLREPDLNLLKRLGFSSVDEHDLIPEAVKAVAKRMVAEESVLHLIPGGAKTVKPEDNDEGPSPP